jgi:hypothetical protein
VDRHARFVLEALVEAPQQGPTPGEHDALVHDVGRQFRRGAVQRGFDRIDDCVHRLFDGFANFLCRDLDRLRQARNEVTAFDLRNHFFGHGEHRGDREFQRLGRAFAEQELVFLLDVLHDRFVEFVSAGAKRC